MGRRLGALLAATMGSVMLVFPPAYAGIGDTTRCLQEAARAGLVSRTVDPATVNVITGTEGSDDFSAQMTSGFDLVCGFGGSDVVDQLQDPDMFLGGRGDDAVTFLHGGTFNGDAGVDTVSFQLGGTFNGGSDPDHVAFVRGGTFNGGAGEDNADFVEGGTFNGGAGDDNVSFLTSGTFNGDEGDDTVQFMNGGTFNGGPDTDAIVQGQFGGTFNQD